MAQVLLIEPDKITGRNYRSALESKGHLVKWVSSGQAGVHAADGQTPDIIILELQMPQHNGVEFLYELRSYPEWQNIPVVLLTVVPEGIVSDSAALAQLGVANYLYKPQTKLKHLLRAVDQAIEAVLT